MTGHALDRPVWNALTTRQAELGIGDQSARRFRPEINMFAAGADHSAASLDAIARFLIHGDVGLVEARPFPAVPGARIEKIATVSQMVSTRAPGIAERFVYRTLGDGDAAAMLALATLTAPGPFFAQTHKMGHFIGVHHEGRLIAMAGQRMRMPGFTEISAVCTHPSFRGRGLAGKLMRVLIDRIVSQGESAFLHVYPHNVGAIALYEGLGFRFRAALQFTILSRATAPSTGTASPARLAD